MSKTAVPAGSIYSTWLSNKSCPDSRRFMLVLASSAREVTASMRVRYRCK
jgi:hypothetical protein